MPSTYTANQRYEKPATGEQASTWGNTVNRVFDLIDASFGAVALDLTTATGPVALTANNGTVDQARAMVVVLGGTPSGSYRVYWPSGITKAVIVINTTTYPQILAVGPTGGVNHTLAPSASGLFYMDGTNVITIGNG